MADFMGDHLPHRLPDEAVLGPQRSRGGIRRTGFYHQPVAVRAQVVVGPDDVALDDFPSSGVRHAGAHRVAGHVGDVVGGPQDAFVGRARHSADRRPVGDVERRARGGMVVSSLRRNAELEELRYRKRAYDEVFVEWNKRIQNNVLQIREVIGVAESTMLERQMQELGVRLVAGLGQTSDADDQAQTRVDREPHEVRAVPGARTVVAQSFDLVLELGQARIQRQEIGQGRLHGPQR